VTIERPKSKDHGDYATNIAMQLAKAAGRPPRDVAAVIATHLADAPGIDRADVAGPGFLNITLSESALGELARTVVTAGADYGHNESLSKERINLEFVSANPTGPIHLGGTRWAAVGDSLARLLAACGADVTREYYFNDHGAQLDRFARSLLARA
jgi:arginyl-tRNA synthetase